MFAKAVSDDFSICKLFPIESEHQNWSQWAVFRSFRSRFETNYKLILIFIQHVGPSDVAQVMQYWYTYVLIFYVLAKLYWYNLISIGHLYIQYTYTYLYMKIRGTCIFKVYRSTPSGSISLVSWPQLEVENRAKKTQIEFENRAKMPTETQSATKLSAQAMSLQKAMHTEWTWKNQPNNGQTITNPCASNTVIQAKPH